jgi:hypothetical protein
MMPAFEITPPGDTPMWKIAVGFAAFAGLALFIMMKSGADIDMGGEKHGIEVHEAPASAPASAPAAPAASAASGA